MRVFGGDAAHLQRTTRALHFQLIGIFFPENCYHRRSCTTLQPSPLIMVCLQTVFRMKQNTSTRDAISFVSCQLKNDNCKICLRWFYFIVFFKINLQRLMFILRNILTYVKRIYLTLSNIKAHSTG